MRFGSQDSEYSSFVVFSIGSVQLESKDLNRSAVSIDFIIRVYGVCGVVLFPLEIAVVGEWEGGDLGEFADDFLGIAREDIVFRNDETL